MELKIKGVGMDAEISYNQRPVALLLNPSAYSLHCSRSAW